MMVSSHHCTYAANVLEFYDKFTNSSIIITVQDIKCLLMFKVLYYVLMQIIMTNA